MFISDFSFFTIYNRDFREKLRSAYEMVNYRQFIVQQFKRESHSSVTNMQNNKKKDFVSGVYENPDHEMNGMEHYIQTDTCSFIKVYI